VWPISLAVVVSFRLADVSQTILPVILDEGGLFLNMVGAGGCRGPKWDKDPRYPKFLGRETLDKCAKKCAKDGECTAIHVLRPDPKDGTVECLHFSHDKVTAVEPLGGHCYEIDDEMEGEDEDDGEHCDIGK
jgi:hypothetical protein